ncbi:MAG: [FeFe] hydrogenase H-cluster radical SAM maturase HydE [Psychrilyobacter sp.]|nr:[FeFe] hydrogenase H-cluster radical SAM maturase HydE [Psychrilyobacter sp.]
MNNIEEILKKKKLTKEDLLILINTEKAEDIDRIYRKAYEVKLENIGNKVYYRGLIEIGNKCIKNCLYCGIRRENKKIEFFEMTREEILESAKWIYENGFASIALQAGERKDEDFVNFIEELLIDIKKISNNKLGVTLSLGEQTYETYKRWYDVGAHRYLLRIESSNKDIYNTLHPSDPLHNHDTRIECLMDLRKIGYQVGTGVMIGLPGQTTNDLVDDILFYEKMDIDMIGMGPYILHDDTPMGIKYKNEVISVEKRVELGLKMIALTRIYLKDVNIAATTALQGLDPMGREKGLKAGANILMPTATIEEHKAKYQLYNDKPGISDNARESKEYLDRSVKAVGDQIIYDDWGDSPHFRKKKMEEI